MLEGIQSEMHSLFAVRAEALHIPVGSPLSWKQVLELSEDVYKQIQLVFQRELGDQSTADIVLGRRFIDPRQKGLYWLASSSTEHHADVFAYSMPRKASTRTVEEIDKFWASPAEFRRLTRALVLAGWASRVYHWRTSTAMGLRLTLDKEKGTIFGDVDTLASVQRYRTRRRMSPSNVFSAFGTYDGDWRERPLSPDSFLLLTPVPPEEPRLVPYGEPPLAYAGTTLEPSMLQHAGGFSERLKQNEKAKLLMMLLLAAQMLLPTVSLPAPRLAIHTLTCYGICRTPRVMWDDKAQPDGTRPLIGLWKELGKTLGDPPLIQSFEELLTKTADAAWQPEGFPLPGAVLHLPNEVVIDVAGISASLAYHLYDEKREGDMSDRSDAFERQLRTMIKRGKYVYPLDGFDGTIVRRILEDGSKQDVTDIDAHFVLGEDLYILSAKSVLAGGPVVYGDPRAVLRTQSKFRQRKDNGQEVGFFPEADRIQQDLRDLAKAGHPVLSKYRRIFVPVVTSDFVWPGLEGVETPLAGMLPKYFSAAELDMYLNRPLHEQPRKGCYLEQCRRIKR